MGPRRSEIPRGGLFFPKLKAFESTFGGEDPRRPMIANAANDPCPPVVAGTPVHPYLHLNLLNPRSVLGIDVIFVQGSYFGAFNTEACHQVDELLLAAEFTDGIGVGMFVWHGPYSPVSWE